MIVQEGDPSISQSGGRGFRNLASPGACVKGKGTSSSVPISQLYLNYKPKCLFFFFFILESLVFLNQHLKTSKLYGGKIQGVKLNFSPSLSLNNYEINRWF